MPYHVWLLGPARDTYRALRRRPETPRAADFERAAVWEKRAAANRYAERRFGRGAFMVLRCGEPCGVCREAPEPPRARPSGAVQEIYRLAKRLPPERQARLREVARELGAALD